MATQRPLHLFYAEPDPDRWLPGDRFPRRLIRRIVRGKPRPGGVMRWFLNLQAGLDRLGAPYHLNSLRALRSDPGSWACVVGKAHVVKTIPAGHPIVYGPGVGAHPLEDDFWGRADIRLILLSCDWFKAMYDRDLPRKIPTAVWPAGVDTDLWRPAAQRSPRRVLVYDKIRWRRDELEPALLHPIIARLRAEGCDVVHLRYGHYREEHFHQVLQEVSAMVFLCEHETQGFAYLQTLACGVPIFAWDRGGYWQDPSMYPHRVKFAPVTSVPYFSAACGAQFKDLAGFQAGVGPFLQGVECGGFRPREYVVENFDLARQAQCYLDLVASATAR